MALRLILVGVVASLALDLPNAGPNPPRPPAQTTRDWLGMRIAASTPEVSASPVVVAESAPTPLVFVDDAPIAPIPPTAPTLAVAPNAPTIPVVADAPKPDAPAVPVVVVEAPKPEAPAAPTPMPAPLPSPELAATSTPNPAADAEVAPVPTIVAAEPMPAPDAVAAPVVVEEAKPSDPDAAFRSIVREMAKEFAADVPAPTSEPKALLAKEESPAPIAPESALPPPPADEVVDAAEVDLYPGLAFALNRSAEGLAPIATGANPRAEPDPSPASAIAEPSIDPSRVERLANAVKLTGQAMNAWAGLLSQRPTVSALQR